MDPSVVHALLAVAAIDSNQTCVDCGEKEPAWASLGFGSFICLNCAGHHRSLGVHITKVRSVRLDGWTREQVQIMEAGGNAAFLSHVDSLSDLPSTAPRRRYEQPQVLYYTELLAAKVLDRPPAPFDPAQYAALGEQVARSLNPSSSAKEAGVCAAWTPDSDAPACMRCARRFGFLVRRHHCRRCGQVVCEGCAPSNNSRPILEWGLKEAVRHCKNCFKSPLVDWKD